jgi:fibronectin-binding autotransporter adhesin
MNKIFRVIWSEAKEKWVVVAESVKSCGGVPSWVVGSAALMAAVMAGALPGYALDPGALPSGGRITSGNGSIATSGSQMTVNQTTQQMIANWNTFNIGANAGVRFVQPNAAATVLNRISDQNPSQIMGSLSANGRVFLLNPSGIVFGPNSQVNVGGLVASTLNMLDADFLAGKYRFQNSGTAGSILNQGSINAAPGGVVALIAPRIVNEGTITAPGGSVALAAGNQVTLDFTGDGLINLAVDEGAVDAHITNRGLIKVDGGMAVMSARSANALSAAAVNNSGIIEAKSLTSVGGKIVLEGDDISLAGSSKLDASGALGGGTVLVGGDWQGSGALRHAKNVTMEPGAFIDASAIDTGNGGKVVLWSDGTTRAAGTIWAKGGINGGDGGSVETSGHILDVSSEPLSVNASAANGKGKSGTWLLDPFDLTVDGVLANNIGTALTQGNNVTLWTNDTGCNQSSLVGGTCTDSGVNGGKITFAAGGLRINKDGSQPGASTNHVIFTVSAYTDIDFVDNVWIQSVNNGGSLAISLQADSKNAGIGHININNSKLQTAGGDIFIGSASGSQIVYGSTNAGVRIMGSTLDAAGGTVRINGGAKGSVTESGNSIYGVQIGTTTVTGNGGIYLKGDVLAGWDYAGAGSNSYPFYMSGTFNSTSMVSIEATNSAAGASGAGAVPQGIYLVAGTTTINGGAVLLKSFINDPAATSYGINVANALNINGNGGNITLQANSMQLNAGDNIRSSGGKLYVLPYYTNSSVGVGSGDLSAYDLKLTQNFFYNGASGAFRDFSGIYLGYADSGSFTGNMGLTTLTSTYPVYMRTSGNVAVGALAAATLSGDITLKAGSVGISNTISGTANLTLLPFADGNSIGLGTGGGSLSLSAVLLSKVSGLTGVFSIGNGSSGSITSGGAIALANNLTLQSGSGISLNGTLNMNVYTLIGASSISANGAAITAAAFNPTSSSANYYFENNGNLINSLYGSVGTLSLFNNKALNVSTLSVNSGLLLRTINATPANAGITINGDITGAASKVLDAGVGVFLNNRGASGIAGANWTVYSGESNTNSWNAQRKNLVYDYRQYNTSYGGTILGTGRGFIYKNAPSLTLTGLSGTSSKVYDGTTAATLTGANYTFTGYIAGDSNAYGVGGTAVYDTKDVGTGKLVTVTGMTSATATDSNGKLVYGYQVTIPDGTNANIGTITKKTVTLTGTKPYDGNTDLTGAVTVGTGVGTETLNYSGATANSAFVADNATNYITALTLLDGTNGGVVSNYQLPTLNHANAPATINKRALAVTLGGDAIKTYDTNTAASMASLTFTPTNIVGTDVVNLVTGAGVATYDTKHASAGQTKTVNVAGITLNGAESGNYSIGVVSGANIGQINKADISATLTGAVTKVYDATDVATVTSGQLTFAGVLGADVVTLTGSLSNGR